MGKRDFGELRVSSQNPACRNGIREVFWPGDSNLTMRKYQTVAIGNTDNLRYTVLLRWKDVSPRCHHLGQAVRL